MPIFSPIVLFDLRQVKDLTEPTPEVTVTQTPFRRFGFLPNTVMQVTSKLYYNTDEFMLS